MRTEIERIEEAVKVYEGYHWRTHKEWLEAENYLCKVFDTYGTINIKEIQNLIR